jgi:L,D-transpeptidase ErfK/SrfK
MRISRLLFILCAILLAAPAAWASDTATGDVFGTVTTYTVKKNEDLSRIAQKFGVSVIELQAANPGVNPWKPKPGTEIKISNMHLVPTIVREGVVINLETSRLFLFKNDKEVLSFPVASGKPGWETPVAATKVILKRKDPIWTPTPRIREENPDLPDFVPAGPNNPLGKYAINLGLNGIMLHGTNAPSSVGKKVSHGCMRMYAKDIETLFHAVKVGTPVLLMKTSREMGWQGNTLYLQLAPRIAKMKREEAKYRPDLDLYAAIQKAAGEDAVIDWHEVEEARLRADGIPVAIAWRPAPPVYGPAPAEPPVATDAKPRRASLEIFKTPFFD